MPITFAQLKVFDNGNVAIGGDNIANSNVQCNILEGENNGFRIYDKTWNEIKFNINTSEFHTYLSGWNPMQYPMLTVAFTSDAGINIGERPYLNEYSGGLLNIFTRNTYGYNNSGIFLRTTNNSSVGIYSAADSNTKLTFASGLTSGNYNFYVRGNGEAYTQGILVTSDSVLKKDIKTMSGSLAKVLQLRGVTYRFKKEQLSINPLEDNFISRNQEENLSYKEHKTGGAIMDVPLLNSAILEKITDEDENLHHMGLLAHEVEQIAPEVVRTSINGTKAIAYTELIALSVRGEGSEVIYGSELSAGIYLYALIADGKEVDVKRMILTE